MQIMVYLVTYKYNTGEPQAVEKCYTPEAARAFAATVELWGGVAVINEDTEEEGEDGNGIH